MLVPAKAGGTRCSVEKRRLWAREVLQTIFRRLRESGAQGKRLKSLDSRFRGNDGKAVGKAPHPNSSQPQREAHRSDKGNRPIDGEPKTM